MENSAPTTWDRVGWVAVVLLLVAFVFAALTPLISVAGGSEQMTAMRDDDASGLVAVQDDDDDDDDTKSRTRTRSVSRDSGSRSIGTNSGNTRTGTTRGTGVSRSVSNSSDRSANTKTGTTRGTGPSRSVSNSS
jgi:hypothetical protein